jgi:hypothetical protein
MNRRNTLQRELFRRLFDPAQTTEHDVFIYLGDRMKYHVLSKYGPMYLRLNAKRLGAVCEHWHRRIMRMRSGV